MSPATAPSLDPPAFLRLAGHALRWRLLGELSRGDRRVHELVAVTGEPQNLVSYHLGKLREAALVSARRSSADGRDSYYAVDLPRLASLLGAAGAALHPGLGLAPPAPDVDRAAGARVLFLCTGNSARSPMAEAMAIARSQGRLRARSAGSHPKPLHPNAVQVMREAYGIDLEGRGSTHVREVARQRFDRVITLCDRVREICPDFRGAPVAAHWSFPDPAAGHDPQDHVASLPAFRRTAAELETRIDFLLADLARPRDPIPDPHLMEATS